MSVNEGVAINLPEIWLRKTSPAVIFVNSETFEEYVLCRFFTKVLFSSGVKK